MSIPGLLMGLVLVLGVAAIVAAPLLRREAKDTSSEAQLQKQRERLLVVYERVLTNIRDLDEDHNTGKMPTGAYQEERELWVQRGIEVLKALDGLHEQQILIGTDETEAIDSAIDQRIEAAVAAYRAKAGLG
jgi:hypothetical protein